MKILVSADLHCSDRIVNGRSRLDVGERLLMDIFRLAVHHKVRHVFLSGDVIDKKERTPRSVLRMVYRCLRHAKFKMGLIVHWIRGNHETPDNSECTDTLMTLFGEVCHTVIQPAILDLPDTRFFMLPWYPAGQFIKYAREFAKKVRLKKDKRNILLTHVGLKEGRISPSNIQLPQRVGISHLYTELYDLVLIGDYHAYQALADNVHYLGAPIPHLFGDEGFSEGPWLVDTARVEMETLDLPHGFPRFRSWTLTGSDGVVLPGYDVRDYHRITAPATAHHSLRSLYPGAVLRVLESPTVLDLGNSRVSAEDLRSPERLLDRFLALRGKGGDEAALLRETGLELLRE